MWGPHRGSYIRNVPGLLVSLYLRRDDSGRRISIHRANSCRGRSRGGVQSERFWAYRTGAMRDSESDFPRKSPLGRWVNKVKKRKGRGIGPGPWGLSSRIPLAQRRDSQGPPQPLGRRRYWSADTFLRSMTPLVTRLREFGGSVTRTSTAVFVPNPKCASSGTPAV